MRPRQVVKILVGMLYSYIGLTLFLTGVNVGFMPAGSYLWETAGLPSLPVDHCSCGNADWLLHRESRARRTGA